MYLDYIRLIPVLSNRSKKAILSSVLSCILLGSMISPVFGQGVETSGGVDVPGSWYVGENLKKGDYFVYDMCELDLNDCAPVTIKFWIRGDIKKGSETLWDTVVLVNDGNKIIKGTMGLGKVAPEPVSQSDDLFDYALAFKSSLAWLSAFATADPHDLIHGPKEFRAKAWGKIGAIGGAQLIPLATQTISVPAGTFDTVVVGWYSGNENRIWIKDDFPFPIKALTYAWVTTGVAPIQYQFELQEYKQNVTTDPFVNEVASVEEKKLLGCATDYEDYTSTSKSTNTFSMLLQIAYAPKKPKEGCAIDWKINFKDKYNENDFVNEVHFDIWVVDDKGNKVRSYAEDIGRDDIYNGFGLAHINMPVKESAGVNHYAIFVYGTGPQHSQPAGDLAGYAIVDVEIAPNPNLDKVNGQQPQTSQIVLPSWIKNNAKWWADGTIGDSDFLSGIQYMIKNNIIKIPSTQQGSSSGDTSVPSWIKNNAKWWADGTITNEDFVKGIQYLVQHGIIRV